MGTEFVAVNFLCLRNDPERDRDILEKLSKKGGFIFCFKCIEITDTISSFLREKFETQISCVYNQDKNVI